MLVDQRRTIFDYDREDLPTSYSVDENVKCCSHSEKQSKDPQKGNVVLSVTESSIRSPPPASRLLQKESICSHETYIQIVMADLFIRS